MKLSEYFENSKGVGILSTADKEGKVNAAIYSRPHFMGEDTIAFIAADRFPFSFPPICESPKPPVPFRYRSPPGEGRWRCSWPPA